MARWQEDWKTIYQTDTEWLRIRTNGTEPTLEVAQEVGTYEDENGDECPTFDVYRFDIERFKLVADPEDYKTTYLVPDAYTRNWPHRLSSYEEWFAHDLESVAHSIGENPLVVAEWFTSDDPHVRAGAYMAVAGYHGLANFDGDPLHLTKDELDKRWS